MKLGKSWSKIVNRADYGLIWVLSTVAYRLEGLQW